MRVAEVAAPLGAVNGPERNLNRIGIRYNRHMSRVAGADGCRAGWICVIRDLTDGGLDALLVRDASQLVTLASSWDILAVDIPVGQKRRCLLWGTVRQASWVWPSSGIGRV